MIYFIVCKPFESSKIMKIEFFNEYTSVVLMLTALGLTSANTSLESKPSIGSFFIVLVLINISLHLTLLIIDSGKKIKVLYKLQKAKC